MSAPTPGTARGASTGRLPETEWREHAEGDAASMEYQCDFAGRGAVPRERVPAVCRELRAAA